MAPRLDEGTCASDVPLLILGSIQIGNRGNGNGGLPGLVVILHRPVLGSLRRKAGGGQNLHLKDSRQHPAQGRACCTHTRRVFPISRFAANRETGDFPIPDSDSGRVGNRGFPPRFQAKSGIGGTPGSWGLLSPGLVVILHRPVLGSLRRKAGGGQNLHLKDSRQHPAQDDRA